MPHQVGELSPKKYQSIFQGISSLALMEDLLCQKGVGLMERPCSCGSNSEPGQVYLVHTGLETLHLYIISDWYVPLLPQRPVHPEHSQVTLFGLWWYPTWSIEDVKILFRIFKFLIICLLHRHFVFLCYQSFSQQSSQTISWGLFLFLFSSWEVTVFDNSQWFVSKLFLKDFWL